MADTQTLESDPFQITSQQLPGLTRSLNFKTVTTFEKDNNNKIIDSSKKTILQYQATPGGIFQSAATSTEGGKAGSWTPINAANSNTPILGQAAINSLQTPNGVLNQETQKSVGIAATKEKLSPEEIKKLSDKTKNQASPTGAGTSPVAVPVDLQKEIGPSSFKATRKSYPDLRYPIDLANTKQDVIKFTMLEYQPKKFSEDATRGDLGGFSGRDKERNGIGSVVLPISSGISDTNACDWQSDSMNAYEAALANIALTGITKGIGDAAGKLGEIGGAAAKSPDVKTGFAGLFAGLAIGGSSRQILQRTEGAILNPNMELLFNGPTLRPFSFTFKMSARNKLEAEQIIGIIRFFKQGMSPQKSASNLFLKSPNTFRIQYLHLGEDHPYIGKIKECALQSVTVSYTPEGQYATYVDGYMVSYEMQMQFQELEPIFNDDYGQGAGSSGPDKEIGF